MIYSRNRRERPKQLYIQGLLLGTGLCASRKSLSRDVRDLFPEQLRKSMVRACLSLQNRLTSPLLRKHRKSVEKIRRSYLLLLLLNSREVGKELALGLFPLLGSLKNG